MVTENHYLHRKCPCTFAFGMLELDSLNFVGVVVYDNPFVS